MITALRHLVACDHAQAAASGQLTFIGVGGDAIVVDVVPFARQVWLGISLDLDGETTVMTLRVEAPGYDHAVTIVIPAGPSNTGLILPVTVPAGDQGEFRVSFSHVGGPERAFSQQWRLEATDSAERLTADEAAAVLEAANRATASVFAQIAAQQAGAKH